MKIITRCIHAKHIYSPLEINAFSLAGGKLKNKSKVKNEKGSWCAAKRRAIFHESQSLICKFCIKVKLTQIKIKCCIKVNFDLPFFSNYGGLEAIFAMQNIKIIANCESQLKVNNLAED